MSDTNYYFSERSELIPFIPTELTRTLDVGCASGTFSEQLKTSLGVETWGVEIVEQYAKIAELKLDNVLTGSFDDVCDRLPKNYFDCIFFNDVLEHMVNPDDCLKKIKENLKPGKSVIASIPNVRHIEVLKGLLLHKDWRYTDSGIMDRTHLRFYTKKSIIRMFDDCGYKIQQIQGINSIGRYCATSVINALLFNALEDVKYKQYVVVATPK